jgi:hypothetical protein
MVSSRFAQEAAKRMAAIVTTGGVACQLPLSAASASERSFPRRQSLTARYQAAVGIGARGRRFTAKGYGAAEGAAEGAAAGASGAAAGGGFSSVFWQAAANSVAARISITILRMVSSESG